jgi:hypothetical protein
MKSRPARSMLAEFFVRRVLRERTEARHERNGMLIASVNGIAVAEHHSPAKCQFADLDQATLRSVRAPPSHHSLSNVILKSGSMGGLDFPPQQSGNVDTGEEVRWCPPRSTTRSRHFRL